MLGAFSSENKGGTSTSQIFAQFFLLFIVSFFAVATSIHWGWGKNMNPQQLVSGRPGVIFFAAVVTVIVTFDVVAGFR